MGIAISIPKQEKPKHPLTKFTMLGRMMGVPMTAYCRGCGYGAIGAAISRIYKEEKLDLGKYPILVGVGCYSQMPIILPGNSLMVPLSL